MQRHGKQQQPSSDLQRQGKEVHVRLRHRAGGISHGEVDAERKPIRPKLGPDQYRITRLYISFPSETVRNAWEEQDIEIPAGANPDNRRGRHTPPPPTALFPFMDDLPKGKMSAEQPVIVIPD